MDKRLGGAMVWALDLDDFDGKFCPGGQKFPLLRKIKDTLDEGPKSPPITPAATPPTSPWPAPSGKCHYIYFYIYHNYNNRPSSVNQKSLVHKPDNYVLNDGNMNMYYFPFCKYPTQRFNSVN